MYEFTAKYNFLAWWIFTGQIPDKTCSTNFLKQKISFLRSTWPC